MCENDPPFSALYSQTLSCVSTVSVGTVFSTASLNPQPCGHCHVSSACCRSTLSNLWVLCLQYGALLQTAGESSGSFLKLPSPLTSSLCADENPAGKRVRLCFLMATKACQLHRLIACRLQVESLKGHPLRRSFLPGQ